MTRQEALKKQARFYDGKACPRNATHGTLRYISGQCVQCARIHGDRANRKWRTANPAARLVRFAKRRASLTGLPFDIDAQDVKNAWPKDNRCPIFGTEFVNGKRVPESPSLDKIKPCLGYVKGNIAILSLRANLVKNDVTDPEVFIKLAEWLKKVL